MRAVQGQPSPLDIGLRLRLMLTLTAVALFPIACVSYVIVRDEVGNVTRSIDYEARASALASQSRFAHLLDQRELQAVAAASSTTLQTALRHNDTKSLSRFARRDGVPAQGKLF